MVVELEGGGRELSEMLGLARIRGIGDASVSEYRALPIRRLIIGKEPVIEIHELEPNPNPNPYLIRKDLFIEIRDLRVTSLVLRGVTEAHAQRHASIAHKALKVVKAWLSPPPWSHGLPPPPTAIGYSLPGGASVELRLMEDIEPQTPTPIPIPIPTLTPTPT